MTGYTKLFGSIIASTIWRESKETKILWITMLAMKNEFDVVQASLPGLADMARLSVEETQLAVKCLEAQDPWSRTKDHDGRRIEPIDGGWRVLNGEKYRRLLDHEDQKNKAAERQRRRREKLKSVTLSVTECHVSSRVSLQAEAEAEAKEKTPAGVKGKSKIKTKEAQSTEFTLFWQAYPKRVGLKCAVKAWGKLDMNPDLLRVILEAISEQKKSDQWQKDGGQFIPYPATWLNAHRWLDERMKVQKKHDYGKNPTLEGFTNSECEVPN